jgi:hypothetical protein
MMEESRRKFLFKAGKIALVIGAGAYALRTCDSVPDSAAEAWQGPPELSDDEQDIRQWALAYAILAPSPNNMQPWQVDLRDSQDTITLYIDEERLQPETDPFARQTMIALGGFIESLVIAASHQGYRADIAYFPEGNLISDKLGQLPVATIRMAEDKTVSADPLFEFLTKRRSNRQLYQSTPLSDEHRNVLQAAMEQRNTTVDFVSHPDVVDELRLLVVKAVGVQMTTPATMQEFIANTRIGAGSIADNRDGNALNGIPVWWLQKTGRLSEANASTPGSMGYAAIFGDSTVAMAATPGFVIFESAGTSRTNQLETGRSYLRFNLLATQSGVSVQPVNHALADFPEMRGVREALHHALNKTTYRTFNMLVRIGYGLEDVPQPTARRKLEDILITDDAEQEAS